MDPEQDVRLQSSIGDAKPFDRKDQAMSGMIAIARIIKIHYKHHTADIQMVPNKDVMVGTTIKNGIDGVQLSEPNAGWDEKYEVYYGRLTPYRVGQLVIVIFAEQMKDRPFIIGTVHEVNHEHNPFPLEPYNPADEKHIYESMNISRLQDYWYFNGISEWELVHHSHSYLVSREYGRNGDGINDARTGFNWERLYLKNKYTKKTLTLPEDKRQSIPMDYLLHFAQGPEDDAGFLRCWVRSKTSEVRFTQDLNDNKLSMIQVGKDGAIHVRRQLDSNVVGGGSNFAEVIIQADGTIKVERTSGTTSKVTMTPDTIKMDAVKVVINAEQTVDIKAQKTTVHGDFYTVEGFTYLEE